MVKSGMVPNPQGVTKFALFPAGATPPREWSSSHTASNTEFREVAAASPVPC